MKIRRYQGKSLEAIREKVLLELGDDAVIVSTRSEKQGNLLLGRSTHYEVIAAVDDMATPAENAGLPNQVAAMLAEQKEQYLGVRRSLKLLDDKMAEVDAALRITNLRHQSVGSGVLARIHEAWRAPVTEVARELAGGRDPDPAEWHEALERFIVARSGIQFRSTQGMAPDVYCLIGPTGVGKTTTLAKLAARAVLQERLSVGIITIDTFRVGAVDQVREYGNLLGVEVKVAFGADEVAHHLAAFQDRDVVFIDTPGRSQYDAAGIEQIRQCLGESGNLCVALVVPAGVRTEEALHIAANYREMKPAVLILTKTDEASQCDGLTQLIDAAGLPVVYVTDGQQVPEDLAPASAGLIAALIARPSSYRLTVKVGGEAA